MTEEKGWFSIHRKMLDSDRWLSEPFTHGQAWIDLIGLARYKDGFVKIKGTRIDIKRGQLCWSMKSLASRWQWSRGKVDRFLKELKADTQIEQHKSHVTSIITITNYDQYQDNGTTDRATDGQQIEQQTDINNKCNKENKEIINYLNLKTGKAYKPSTGKTKSLISARINDGYSLDDFKKVIDNKCAEWLRNPEMQKYLRPETLFGTKFEGYLNEVAQAPKSERKYTYDN